MKNYSLPTQEQCLEIIKEYHVPKHIVKHCLAVAKLAVFLAKKLQEKKTAVDVELVYKAGLLHDVARVCDFKDLDYRRFEQAVSEQDKVKWQRLKRRYKNVGHENAAFEVLKEKWPVLASTIKKHRYMAILAENTRPNTWEEKLLYYADMRVMHDRIVPLGTRLEEAHKRNVHFHGTEAQSRINTAKVDPLIYRLETEIFDKVKSDPDEITAEVIESYLTSQQTAFFQELR
jgi:uncharacterized protein